MKYMFTYDLMETLRTTNQWLGASARAFGSYPFMAATANPVVEWIEAWGEVTERTFERMVVKPDWGIPTVTGEDGKDLTVRVMTLVEKPFGNLVHFKVPGRAPRKRRVLLVAPMSGHYATLLRKTVISLLPDCEVFVTDWHNARDIPVSKGKFDVEDYTLYLVEFMRHLGSDLHVIAVCQPAPQLVRNLVCVSSIVSHVGASPQPKLRAHVANHAVVQWLLGLWELATSLVSWVPPVPASFGTRLTLPLTGGGRRQGCGSAAPFVGSGVVGWRRRTVRRRRATTLAISLPTVVGEAV